MALGYPTVSEGTDTIPYLLSSSPLPPHLTQKNHRQAGEYKRKQTMKKLRGVRAGHDKNLQASKRLKL